MKAAVVDIASLSVHRGAFCQFLFLWIYYYGSNKFTGKETGKMHLCAVGRAIVVKSSTNYQAVVRIIQL